MCSTSHLFLRKFVLIYVSLLIKKLTYVHQIYIFCVIINILFSFNISKRKLQRLSQWMYNLFYILISYLFIIYKCICTTCIKILTAYWKNLVPKHISFILVQDLQKKTPAVVTKEAQGILYINKFPFFVWINNSTAYWFHSTSDAY